MASHPIWPQAEAPILDALLRYAKVTRFHMPGHRGGRGAEREVARLLGLRAWKNDVTGVPAMDDLHEPTGCIRRAQDLAAQAFGADHTLFSVGGTSLAIKTMVLAALSDGDVAIIPRNIHKSILSALILSGARPVFAKSRYDPYLGFDRGVDLLSVSECIKANPDARAAILVNPTYYGLATDLGPIARALHEKGMLLLVDEAHGPHFRFHPEMPTAALAQGADASAQGAHKMIGALTQASYLHTSGDRMDMARVRQAFGHLSSTSPSYLLLASLDAARRQMALHGTELISRAIAMAEELRHEVNRIPGLYSFGDRDIQKEGCEELDPTKVTVTTRELGITGYAAETFLKDHCDIQVEMGDLYNILVIVSYANTGQEIKKLVRGLRRLGDAATKGIVPKELDESGTLPELPPVPKMPLTPREAVGTAWEQVNIKDSLGRVSAEVVTAYPPGIPILFPGEAIGRETLAYIEIMKHTSPRISGPFDRELNRLRVVKDP